MEINQSHKFKYQAARIFFLVNYVEERPWWQEETERLRGEGDQIMLIDLRFKRWFITRVSLLCPSQTNHQRDGVKKIDDLKGCETKTRF